MMELAVKSILTLILLSLSLYLLLWALRKFFPEHLKTSGSAEGLIKINAISYVDSSNKIVNFSCRDKNYLILMGKNNEILLDSYENKQN